MRKYPIFGLLIPFLVCLNAMASDKDSVNFQSQISFAGLYNPSATSGFVNARAIPQLDYLRDFSEDRRISAEVSANVNLNTDLAPSSLNVAASTGLYRAWVRFSTQRNEIRAGLQQLNFGSATLLRPLQWFDGLNPTDPLRMTEGVWGVLDRVYFKNNSTLWLWWLYGNKDSRVWDPVQLKYNLPEFGFRFQQPVPRGELALSVNHRSIQMNLGTSLESRYSLMKVGLDGKWDLGPGIWFEDSYTFTSMESPIKSGWNLLTVGADLTPEGLDGLSFTAEHLLSTNFSNAMTSVNSNFSALMATWPINMISRLSGIVLYSWESGYLFRYLTYSADFDKSSFYLIVFWNPNVNSPQMPLGSSSGSFSGYGLQLMYVLHL
jgi:hypothetical protein